MSPLRLLRHGAPPIEVDRDRVLVGREAGCDVVLDDKSVSRRHAFVERRGASWYVADQGSANGTFINGQQVVEAELRQGQELRLGTLSLWVDLPEAVPQTMLMGPEAASAGAWGAQPAASYAPAPDYGYGAQPGYAAPAGYGAAAGYAPAPGYAPASDPQAEAAALLGVAPGAHAQEVAARYRELASDLEAKIQHAPNAHLRATYQQNLEEARRAYEMLIGSPPPGPAHGAAAPAAGGVAHSHLADLPSAQPSMVEEAMESAMEESPRPVAPPRQPVAARASGPSSLTTALGASVVLLLGASTYFCMGASKQLKGVTALERASDTVATRAAWAQYQPVNDLEKSGALNNGKLSLCSKASHPVQVGWLGAVYIERPTDPALAGQGPVVKDYNSMFCAGEFTLTLPPGSEQTVSFKSDKARCNWNGEGLFYGFWVKRTVPAGASAPGRKPTAAPTEQMVYYSGLLNNRKDCVTIGEGW